MRRRHSMPKQWLIINSRIDPQVWNALRKLPPRSGILILHELDGKQQRRVRSITQRGGHIIAREGRNGATRVHNVKELTRALTTRHGPVLLSPVFRTSTHPDWEPLPRMRAATLARLCDRNAVALGGMNSSRYRKVAALGFAGWAGISAFKT